jgi:hypothetical protein
MKIVISILCLLVTFISLIWAILGLIMTASFSETPDYPSELATYNFTLWGAVLLTSGLFFGVSVYFFAKNLKARKVASGITH